jgi:hypothetical protein
LKSGYWFEDTEISVDRDYSIPYERNSHLKTILYDLHGE